jgi:general secretion pathway protein H
VVNVDPHSKPASRAQTPGHRLGETPNPRDAGFSLIEMIVVIALFAGVMSVATIGFRAVTATHLRESAGKVAGALRFAWDQSAMTGRVVRVAFNLDKGTYWLEIEPEQPATASVPKFMLAREKENKQATANDGGVISHAGQSRKPDSIMGESSIMNEPKQYDVTKFKEGSQAATMAAIKMLFGGTPAPQPQTFTRLKQTKHGELKLANKIAFDWIYAPHQRDRYNQGMAFVYFFPQGFAEKAVLQLADSSGRKTWLWVHPLTGRVRVESGEAVLDLGDFEKRDDETNKTEAAPQ